MADHNQESLCQTAHMLYKATPQPVKAGILIAIPVALGLGFGFGFVAGKAPLPRISVEYTVPPDPHVRKEVYKPENWDSKYVIDLTRKQDEGSIADVNVKSLY